METYNYQEAVKNDVREYINEYIPSMSKKYTDKYEAFDDLCEDLFVNDNVTGNGSGSYTFDAAMAKENLDGNEPLICDAYEEFGYTAIPFADMKNPETMDVTIRCYLLADAVTEVIEEMWDGE